MIEEFLVLRLDIITKWLSSVDVNDLTYVRARYCVMMLHERNTTLLPALRTTNDAASVVCRNLFKQFQTTD